jgi:hypothetical protein
MAPSDLNDSLGELEQLLEEETGALRKLDRDAIDRIAAAKLEVCERLSHTAHRAGSSLPDGAAPERRAQLDRIRQKALYNQVLLVHARDSVRGVLDLLTGQSRGTGRATGNDGHRLSVRV